ncbi:hypothetical protein PCASD_00832 [Puccinia coronata f. sp. avenae]|uniref:Uncharacterized protein n=1 Tax=Puccinia coronata f. sp. avenae TaxID=200324 RepID=A0A2N5TD72_9BASI|nr:hypothetical protein PCASD_12750 [Puccinia coronata f. sp. avenae]PLW51909.1 hypothetical protein PCASD_00832 [Puccinia coronata f. sp. avenae]
MHPAGSTLTRRVPLGKANCATRSAGTPVGRAPGGAITPRVQFALRRWVSRTVGSRECYENAPSPNPTFLEHIGSKRPAFSKRPGTTILFRPPIDWKTILVSN